MAGKEVLKYTVGQVYQFDERCVGVDATLKPEQAGIFVAAFDSALKKDSFKGDMLPKISIEKDLYQAKQQEWEVHIRISTREDVDKTMQCATKLMEDTKKGMEDILKAQQRK